MQAKFTKGSIFKHIYVMTFASTAGLIALFFVDLVDMYWLSLLGEIELTAAIGYAGSILFFTLSFSIGLSIACSALVSQSIGGGNKAKTQKLVGNIYFFIALSTVAIAVACFLSLDFLLTALGAEGRSHQLAEQYLRIIIPSMPLLSLAMASNGTLRALGEPKHAMYISLIGGLVNAVLDPLFIFTFDMGIQGAAVATVVSRAAMLAYAYYKVISHHQLISWPQTSRFRQDFRLYCKTAVPSVLTNLATPVGVAYVTAVMAQFGDSAVAGNAIISKIQPLAFAGVFALSGSVGPIAGQNLGAAQFDRIKDVLINSLYFIFFYCVVACVLLLLLNDALVRVFNADQEAEQLIRWFCYGLSSVFLFHGATYVSNAMFNNLNQAHWATVMNFAKSTVFTIPFVYLGGQWAGPLGVLVGQYLGAVLVALLGVWLAYYKIVALKTPPANSEVEPSPLAKKSQSA